MNFNTIIFQVLVHGEQNEMNRLKAALQREYEDDPNTTMQIHNPRNTHSVELYFRGEKTAKVMGQLAVDQPEPGKTLSGILVKRNFNYHILSPDDLSSKLSKISVFFVVLSMLFFLFVFSDLKLLINSNIFMKSS